MDSDFIQLLAGALPGILGISVLVSVRTRMMAETEIWPNTMVWKQKWRYWAHRYGYLYSPSCGLIGTPYGDLRRKPGVGYGHISCGLCGWSTRIRRDVNDKMDPRNTRDMTKHYEIAHPNGSNDF